MRAEFRVSVVFLVSVAAGPAWGGGGLLRKSTRQRATPRVGSTKVQKLTNLFTKRAASSWHPPAPPPEVTDQLVGFVKGRIKDKASPGIESENGRIRIKRANAAGETRYEYKDDGTFLGLTWVSADQSKALIRSADPESRMESKIERDGDTITTRVSIDGSLAWVHTYSQAKGAAHFEMRDETSENKLLRNHLEGKGQVDVRLRFEKGYIFSAESKYVAGAEGQGKEHYYPVLLRGKVGGSLFKPWGDGPAQFLAEWSAGHVRDLRRTVCPSCTVGHPRASEEP